MVGCVKQGTTSESFPILPQNVGFLIHKIRNKIRENYSTSTNDQGAPWVVPSYLFYLSPSSAGAF